MSDGDIVSDERLAEIKGQCETIEDVFGSVLNRELLSIIKECESLRAGRPAVEGGVTRPMIEYRQELREKREAELRAAVWAECREACAKVADGWLASFEDGPEIQFTPARKYAADAVKDIRDALRALKETPDRALAGEGGPHG